jgi:anthranilate phosphoribosyltransferase
VTTTADTAALEVRQGAITDQRIDPAEFGVPRASLDELRGAEAARNAQIAREMLDGACSAGRALIVVNAGCAIYVADQAATIRDGMVKATEAIDSGRARTLLARVVELSHAG